MPPQSHWVDGYGPVRYGWRAEGDYTFYRRIGIVEGLFDTDGVDCEGRADLSMHLHLNLKTRLSPQKLRAHILLAWSVMRQKHVLLSTRVMDGADLNHALSSGDVVKGERLQDNDAKDRFFVFKPCRQPGSMLTEAAQHAVFVEDHSSRVDVKEFFIHTQNTRRCINPEQAMSKLYILPVTESQLHLVFIAAHQIVDGLTSSRWMASFIHLLNLSRQQLESETEALCSSTPLTRFPPAQEALYPLIKGSEARQRWSWLLSRILRHTRRSNPAAFQNPLRRTDHLSRAAALNPKFPGVLDYSRLPPQNTFPLTAVLSPASTRRISRICRDAKISVGSGCFALVAIVMMLFEEKRNPQIPLHERLPFVGSFPINPRPFLSGEPTTGKEDSLMLAFSDGITLPFLSSDLSLKGRIRLLGKMAHRQLRQYQKRPRSKEEQIQMGSRSPTQLIPLLYLNTMEYLERKSQPERKRGWNIQGAYPAAVSPTMSTCGVSSVGARGSVLRKGMYDTSTELPEHVDVVADFRGQDSRVRAREGEFLVGVIGDDVLRFGVSYDGCAIDPALAEQWKDVMERILEEPGIQEAARQDERSAHKL
ncbi:hypothetical protein H2200_005412 [Cladophialophora chaetospira]|uniref:Uncharacterized protein n=1 Tax=Cladophialophora chaetospira TaxID=386627 RepID=A0AA39CJL3_9EURO|nr:hypothetical protein H2200_005412 [Cladophialophora chaetospira]